MDLPGYDFWKTAPPDEPLCDCRAEDCEECQRIAEAEAVFERWVDREVDAQKERDWERR